MTNDVELVSRVDKAFREAKSNFINFGLKLKEVKEAQAYVSDYDSFGDFVFDRYGIRLRSAQHLISTAEKFKAYKLQEQPISISKAHLIAPRLNNENAERLVALAQTLSFRELKQKLKDEGDQGKRISRRL